MSRAILLSLLASAACSPEVPAQPTWIDDVRPILAANCIRCHSPPHIGGAPDTFRLDKYDTELVPDGTDENDTPDQISGAEAQSFAMSELVVDEIMPPRFPLADYQQETLAAWDAAGAPRGEPRSDNASPSLTLLGDPVVSPGRVRFEYQIDDADGDIVTGGILPADQLGDSIYLSNQLFVGRGVISLSLASGSHELVAELDDGHEVVEVELATVEVP